MLNACPRVAAVRKCSEILLLCSCEIPSSQPPLSSSSSLFPRHSSHAVFTRSILPCELHRQAGTESLPSTSAFNCSSRSGSEKRSASNPTLTRPVISPFSPLRGELHHKILRTFPPRPTTSSREISGKRKTPSSSRLRDNTMNCSLASRCPEGSRKASQ